MPLPYPQFPKNNAREWSRIVEHFAELNHVSSCRAMEELVRYLESAGFVAAGLRGTTSMVDLLLGQTSDVLNNPHLRISPVPEGAKLTYEDGSDPEWSVEVSYGALIERVERFLIKRARWFTKS